MRALLAALALATLLPGCRAHAVFECAADDGACDQRPGGACVAAAGGSFCAYPDGDCGSGLAFGDTAADGLAGQCTTAPDAGAAPDAPVVADASPDATVCGGQQEACCLVGDGCDPGLECGLLETCGCVREITAGDVFTCARKTNGRVVCWGNNTYGQVGAGPGLNFPLPTEVVAPLPADVTLVAAGPQHACALSASMGLYCWGSNSNRQLGQPAAVVSSDVPMHADLAPAGILQLVGATGTTCVRLDEGGVRCWGSNQNGELGLDAITADTEVPQTPMPLPSTGWLMAGVQHVCAIASSSGAVSCWGANQDGQLGLGDQVGPRLAPIQLPGVSVLDRGDAGARHTCLRVSTGLLCFGNNADSQCGQDSASSPVVDEPTLVTLSTKPQDIALGSSHSCVIITLGSDVGQVYCWGSDQFAQLGREPGDAQAMQDSATPVKVMRGVGVPLDHALQLVAGSSHTCMLDQDGKVWCWGEGSRGQLGDGQSANFSGPVEVQLTCP